MTTRYVANQPIRHGWALAFNTGDPVPEDNVLAHGYLDDGLVDPVDADADGRPEALQTEADREAVKQQVDADEAIAAAPAPKPPANPRKA